MIYEKPRYLPSGDRFMLVEFGNELNFELSFVSQEVAQEVADQKIKGVIETAPFPATLLLHYEPDDISFDDLKTEIGRLIASLKKPEEVEVDSRLLYLPAVYLDPWSSEAIDRYIEQINPDKERDPEFIARINGLEDVHQFVRVHSGTEYWVAALGFWPGTPFMIPLDPRCRLFAPKYNPPRIFTYQGTIGMGGAQTAIYPVDGPGGYQIFARTPVPIWDMKKRLPQFEEAPYLLRPTDRIKWVPCSLEEFDDVKRQVEDGTYVMNVVGYQRISIKNYRAWVATLDLDARF